MTRLAAQCGMGLRKCTCGADPDVGPSTRRTTDGRDVAVQRVACPVCGQLGPAVPVEGRGEAAAIAEAIAAWNAMIARLRPLEA